MNCRKSFALTAVSMLLSASLVMAQGSAPSTSGTPVKGAKPAASAAAKTKAAATTTAAKPAAAAAAAKPTAAAAAAKPAAAAAAAKPAAAVAEAKPAAAAAAKPVAAAAAAKPAAVGALVDLNSASKAELMKLPGIGEAISAKIIAGRPWANKAQLVSKGLVTKTVYDKLSASVIAKQAK
jgi:competence protein ComEA